MEPFKLVSETHTTAHKNAMHHMVWESVTVSHGIETVIWTV